MGYPAEDFNNNPGEPLAQVSVGDWLACDECAALIQRNEWEKLARRGLLSPTVAAAVALLGEEPALAEIRRLQKGFRQHRRGRVRCER